MTARAREGLFSALGPVTGARVLDLYAGTGSLGLEALSRGAAGATFVERSARALRSLQANIEAVGLGGTVHGGDVAQFLAVQEGTFDLVFVDPPYDDSLASVEEVMSRLEPRLAPEGTLVVRRRVGGLPPVQGHALRLVARHRYGDDELFRYVKDSS